MKKYTRVASFWCQTWCFRKLSLLSRFQEQKTGSQKKNTTAFWLKGVLFSCLDLIKLSIFNPNKPHFTSWWLNQPCFEKHSSKLVHLPQFSGEHLKKMYLKAPPSLDLPPQDLIMANKGLGKDSLIIMFHVILVVTVLLGGVDPRHTTSKSDLQKNGENSWKS